MYWVRPPLVLSAAAGMHRFIWDLHYAPAPGVRSGYPIAAVYRNTPLAPTSPWVMPGQYSAKLTVGGRSYTQPLTVKMDPRVKTPEADLSHQFTLSKQLYDDAVATSAALEQLRALRSQLRTLKERAGQGGVADAIIALDQKAEALAGREAGRFGGAGGGADSLGSVRGALMSLMGILQGADVAPTTQAVAAVAERRQALAALIGRWNELKTKDIPAVNDLLRKANLPELKLESPAR